MRLLKNEVPIKLNANQIALKKNAEDLNAESKHLLIQASQEQNESAKIKLLTLSAKSGNAAVEQLHKLIPKKAVFAKATPKANKSIEDLDNIGNKIAESNVKTATNPKTRRKK